MKFLLTIYIFVNQLLLFIYSRKKSVAFEGVKLWQKLDTLKCLLLYKKNAN